MIISQAISFIRRFINRKLKNRLKTDLPPLTTPLSDMFGLDRGTPLDRVFISRFLQHHGEIICGDCLEVEESLYTRRYAQPDHVAHVLKYTPSLVRSEKNELVADLTRPETVPEARFDTFICTQTLNFIFDLDPVITSIHKLLKPRGYALITVAGISQISQYDHERWGDYWRFTDQSLRTLLIRRFNDDDCKIVTYGNVYTACLFLQGYAYEDIIDKSLLKIVDKNYQMVICALVRK